MFLVLSLFLLSNTSTFTSDLEKIPGYFDVYRHKTKGTVYLGVKETNKSFIFASSLATGLGSNPIGMDRSKPMSNKLVHFHRSGNRLFLIEENTRYVATTDNPKEKAAVAESFATSTLWSGEILAEEDGALIISLDSFLFRDEPNLATTLENREHGSYGLDTSLCFHTLQKSFPNNTEIGVSLGYQGTPSSDQIPMVTPTPSHVSLGVRYSFIKLPEDDYQAREFHPGCGGFAQTIMDLGAPLDESIHKKFVFRHHLVRKHPEKKRSELVEPLVYYVDSGAPPEIRKALVEGASWWNDAFEAAGIIDGFRVEVLPDGVDPLDVRYNVIQWVHRATRGWSYGASISDPRNGRILKGHVLLGSQRVRQDRMIFEGCIPRDKKGRYPKNKDKNPLELSLARIRQLSAHEVGHTLGIAHNFAASADERSSVMDYPAPKVAVKNGKLDFSSAYAVGIGEWDKVSVTYLYGSFEDESKDLEAYLVKMAKKGHLFIGDEHSRGPEHMHPKSALWDNGENAIMAFEEITRARQIMLTNLNSANLPKGAFPAQMAETLVPIYLFHRYQLEACAKSIGGMWFDYHRNQGQHLSMVPRAEQERALTLILETLTPDFLMLPNQLRNTIPPMPPGFYMYEAFDSDTGAAFDILAPADAAIELTLTQLLNSNRLNRLHRQELLGLDLSHRELFDRLIAAINTSPGSSSYHTSLQELINTRLIDALNDVVQNENVTASVRADLNQRLAKFMEGLNKKSPQSAHELWLVQTLNKKGNAKKPTYKNEIPPGSPIGASPLGCH